jgi:Tfp pilus assembly protein PilN
MERINLIPPEFAVGEKALIETGLRRRAMMIGLVLAALFFVHYGINRITLFNLNHETARLEHNLTEATALSEATARSKEAVNLQLQNLEKRMNDLLGKQFLLQRLGGGQFKWSEALDHFHESIPEKVWVDELILDELTCQVKGGTFSNELVGAFIDGLNQSPFFADATFSRTEAGTINKKPVVLYELNFDLVKKQKI